MSTASTLLSLGAGLAGGLSNTAKARTGTSTVSPTVAPAYQTLADMLRKRAEARLGSKFPIAGLEATGIQNVNDAYKGSEAALDASLTSRGLGTSPIAGNAVANLETSRAGDIASWLNQLPMIQRDMENQDFQQAQGLYETGLGKTSTSTEPGSAVGSGIGSAAEMLAYLNGQGAFGGKGGGGIPGLDKLGSALGIGTGAAAGGGAGITSGAVDAALTGIGGGIGAVGPSAAVLPSVVMPNGSVIAGSVAPGLGGAGGGGGFGTTLTALASNPVTWAVAGALAAGAIWLKSQAHWEANTAVKDFENPFHENSLAPFAAQWDAAIKSGRMNRQQGAQAFAQYGQNWNDYIDKIKQWGQKGDKQQVALQSIKNLYDTTVGPQVARMQREIAALPA